MQTINKVMTDPASAFMAELKRLIKEEGMVQDALTDLIEGVFEANQDSMAEYVSDYVDVADQVHQYIHYNELPFAAADHTHEIEIDVDCSEPS